MPFSVACLFRFQSLFILSINMVIQSHTLRAISFTRNIFLSKSCPVFHCHFRISTVPTGRQFISLAAARWAQLSPIKYCALHFVKFTRYDSERGGRAPANLSTTGWSIIVLFMITHWRLCF